MPRLLANVSTFRLTTAAKDKWIDIGMNSDSVFKVRFIAHGALTRPSNVPYLQVHKVFDLRFDFVNRIDIGFIAFIGARQSKRFWNGAQKSTYCLFTRKLQKRDTLQLNLWS